MLNHQSTLSQITGITSPLSLNFPIVIRSVSGIAGMETASLLHRHRRIPRLAWTALRAGRSAILNNFHCTTQETEKPAPRCHRACPAGSVRRQSFPSSYASSFGTGVRKSEVPLDKLSSIRILPARHASESLSARGRYHFSIESRWVKHIISSPQEHA